MKRNPNVSASAGVDEDAFFSALPSAPAGAPADDNDDEPPGRPSLHRVVLTLAVLASVGWLLAPLADELRYHFSGVEIVDIGDATGIGPENVPPLGAYVRVRGVLGNKAASLSGVLRPGSLRAGAQQVRQLLGSALFVEFDQAALGDRYTAFTRVTVEGRVASLAAGGELAPVRRYFEERLRLEVPQTARVIVVDERPGELWRYPVVFVLALCLAASSLFFLVRGFVRR